MNPTIRKLFSRLSGFMLRNRKAVLFFQVLCFATAAFLCTRISFDSTIGAAQGSRQGASVETNKGASGIITLSLELDADPYAPASIGKLDALVARLGKGDGYWQIIRPDTNSVNAGEAIFLSPDRTSWSVFLNLKPDADPALWYPELRAVRRSMPRLHISGQPYLSEYIEAKLAGVLPLLLGLASLVLLLVYWAIFRRIRTALRAWTSSIVPALMTAAFFPAIGRPMTIYSFIAPICALAVSSSYGIHALRGLAENKGDYQALLENKGPIIFLDYFTTFLGFSTLLCTPLQQLRIVGIASMLGVTVSFIVGFLVLPLSDLQDVGIPPTRVRSSAFHANAPSPIAAVALAVILGLCFSGWGRLQIRASAISALGTSDEACRDATYFEKHYGALDTINLRIDSGREYGLVDLGLFRSIEAFQKRLGSDPLIARSASYVDVTQATLGSLPGGGKEPASGEEIGEALELISSSSFSSYSDLLIDRSWRTATAWFMLKPGYEGRGLLESLNKWDREARDAGISGRLSWDGAPLGTASTNLNMARSQALSLLGYFAAIFLVLLTTTRSFRKSLLIITPPFAAILATIGFSGLMGWPLDSGSALGLAIIAGIGIDDALVFVLSKERTPLMFASIVETTFVLVLTLSTILVSGFALVAQLYALSALGLCLSTSIVLLLIPVLEKIGKR